MGACDGKSGAARWRRPWIAYDNSGPHIAKDYEDCAEEAQANAASKADYSKLVTHCGERFAGRRKLGGGYTYFDFLQNRSFDIAGPNPDEDERKHIDRSYMEFLGSQRREMLLADLAKAQANLEQATSEAVSTMCSAIGATNQKFRFRLNVQRSIAPKRAKADLCPVAGPGYRPPCGMLSRCLVEQIGRAGSIKESKRPSGDYQVPRGAEFAGAKLANQFSFDQDKRQFRFPPTRPASQVTALRRAWTQENLR